MEIPGLGGLQASLPLSAASQVNSEVFVQKRLHFRLIKYIFECGEKLGLSTLGVATAAHLYHRVFQECQIGEFDPYLIGCTCLYLSSKVEEDHKRLRDVINVCYRNLHQDRPPLDIGVTYWSMRESIVQCELFVMRLLKFEVVICHPHKYLLHYLMSLNTWLHPDTVSKVPYAQTAWTILKDSYHGNTCVRYPASWIAVAALYLSLQCHGVSMPYNDNAEYRWWEAFVEDLQLTDVRKIICEIMDTYDMETLATS